MPARLCSILVCFSTVVVGTPARADDAYSDNDVTDPMVNPYAYAWSDPRMLSRIGVGFTLGGGVTGFTAQEVRDVIDNKVGGVWTARVSIGTHIPIGVELVYFGNASSLQTLTNAHGGMLIGTTFEAAARYTIVPLAQGTPYLFAGVGWQRYDVRDARPELADTGIRDSDQMLEFPLGIGVAYRDPTGWVGDVRGTFRASTDSSLLTESNGGHARLDSWEASASIGYEF